MGTVFPANVANIPMTSADQFYRHKMKQNGGHLECLFMDNPGFSSQ
jgi:hypothetical protein